MVGMASGRIEGVAHDSFQINSEFNILFLVSYFLVFHHTQLIPTLGKMRSCVKEPSFWQPRRRDCRRENQSRVRDLP